MSGYINITWAVTCPHCGQVYYLSGMAYTLGPQGQAVTCPQCRQVHKFVRGGNAVSLSPGEDEQCLAMDSRST